MTFGKRHYDHVIRVTTKGLSRRLAQKTGELAGARVRWRRGRGGGGCGGGVCGGGVSVYLSTPSVFVARQLGLG